MALRLVKKCITLQQFDSPVQKLDKICLSAAIFADGASMPQHSYPETSYLAAACHNKILRDRHYKQLLWKNDSTVVC